MDPRSTPSIMRGAVDLSALRDRAAAQQRPAAQPAPASSPAQAQAQAPGSPADAGQSGQAPPPGIGGLTVIDVTDATFQSEVVERSLQVPVVIDLWAQWCEPCKQLSPVLEKLAVEGNGSWVLAKVDIDANPGIRQLFQVQGIPMVVAVLGGRPVDAFQGVQPEAQLRAWLDSLMRAAGVDAPEPDDPALNAADDALMNGDLDEAERAYKKVLSDRPADAAAAAGLAQVTLLRRVEGKDPATVMAQAQAKPDDVIAQGLAADFDVLSGNAERGYQRLIEFVRRVRGEERDAARDHLVSLFAIASSDDPAVVGARRALASALF